MNFLSDDESLSLSDSDLDEESDALVDDSEEEIEIRERTMKATNLFFNFNDKEDINTSRTNNNLQNAQLHDQKFCLPSSQKKIIITKNQDDLNFEASQLKLLTHESIMRATLFECCSKNCLASISKDRENGNFKETYQLIKACRLELIGLDKKQRMDEIRNLLNGY